MPSWTLEKSFSFEASHQLMHHDGKCRRLHGHSWKGKICIVDHELETDGPKRNMVLDYADLSAVLKPLVEEFLDHHHLNDSLETDSPTSEFIACWIYDQLKPLLPTLACVEIEETCTSRCIYSADVRRVPLHINNGIVTDGKNSIPLKDMETMLA